MITDRDMAVRAVAEGRGSDAKVRDVMSAKFRCCFEDEDVDDVLRNMGEIQVRRLPVGNRDRRLVGIVSLSDTAAGGDTPRLGEVLREIAQPGGQHSQTH